MIFFDEEEILRRHRILKINLYNAESKDANPKGLTEEMKCFKPFKISFDDWFK